MDISERDGKVQLLIERVGIAFHFSELLTGTLSHQLKEGIRDRTANEQKRQFTRLRCKPDSGQCFYRVVTNFFPFTNCGVADAFGESLE